MAGVETTGFVRPLHADCVQEIVDECRATVDSEYDDSPDSATGQLATIVGGKHAEFWEVLEAVYNSLGPSASGISLDRVAALSNSKRKGATATLLSVTITGANGSNAPLSISLSVDGQDVTFRNRDTLVISGGSGTGVFACDTTGPIRPATGTLGPNVTSFALITLGQTAERDPRLRVRRRDELADEGTSTVPALRAALSKLENVITPRVYTNRNFTTDGEGRPPKSMEAVVLVADDADAALQPIVDTIWANLSAGIETYGSHSLTVIDEEGNAQEVKFSLATPTDLSTIVTVLVDAAVFPGSQAVRQAIADFTSGVMTLQSSDGAVIEGLVDVGGLYSRTAIAAAALTVPGVRSVSVVTFSDGGPYLNLDYRLAARAYAGADGARGIPADHVQVLPVEV